MRSGTASLQDRNTCTRCPAGYADCTRSMDGDDSRTLCISDTDDYFSVCRCSFITQKAMTTASQMPATANDSPANLVNGKELTRPGFSSARMAPSIAWTPSAAGTSHPAVNRTRTRNFIVRMAKASNGSRCTNRQLPALKYSSRHPRARRFTSGATALLDRDGSTWITSSVPASARGHGGRVFRGCVDVYPSSRAGRA